MVIAARTTTNLAATITQTNLVAAIKTAMINAGFSTLYDDYTSTNRILVYEVVNDTSKTYGKNYFVISISSALVVATQIFSTWNATTHTGTGGSAVTTFSAFATGSSISFTAFSAGDELKLVIAVQGSVVVMIGSLIPAIRPSWWDLNLWNWGFYPTATTLSTWKSTSINPYSNENYQFLILTSTFLATANPQTNKRDVITGLLLASSSNTGIAGKTSDDIACVCASGSSRYDTIQPNGTTQIFTILNNASGGFAVRTT
ncbi:hypothetical protein [Nostoc sp. FACHB-280]|uniref:hypothetical protein n=1 Tax=Nostoc sp. FACHB-280 TaxID=2692839 RepID=UPI00168B635A|nr:hypothetical protein [Nostoc sp. FACHB-280]MBD2495007.1 hypothetical protein [Nostoc sp. FACHB-280]